MMGFAWIVLSVLISPPQSSEAEILGLWLTENDDAVVEIYKCGEKICGKIVDLKETLYPANDKQGMAGQPKVDRENPDRSLRARPIIGLVMVEGFTANKKGWGGGTIYDPDKGKTYRCKMKLVDGGKKLYVRGFVGVSVLGRTTYWRRKN